MQASSEERFTFRYAQDGEGRLTVWFRFEDQPEVGPIALTAAEADQLSELWERGTQLLRLALDRTDERPVATAHLPSARAPLRLV